MTTSIRSVSGADPAPPKRLYPVRADLRLAGASPATVALVVLLVTSVLFLKWPGIDLAVSQWFYTPDQGFLLKSSDLAGNVRSAGKVAFVTVAVAALGLLVTTFVSGRLRPVAPPSCCLYLLATLAVGPGLLVNGVLKNFWGRARPRHTLDFGGEWPFSPAWLDADHCAGNCSFVSGEAAVAFWLVGLTLVVPARLRIRTLAATLPFAAAVSLNRVLYGAHFLSDVVIAWAIIWVVLIVLSGIFLAPGRAAVLDRLFSRSGGPLKPAGIRRSNG